MGRRGFALASLILFVTAVTVIMASAVPLFKMQARRAEEEELIFRGEEYMRAIQKYQRKFKTYPMTLDALLNTNGIRFLRRAYADPISGRPFRPIYIHSDGSLTGSTVFTQTVNGTQATVPFYRQQAAQASQAAQPPQVDVAWVIGVAPSIEGKSVTSYNGRSSYREWEFIAILR